MPLFEIEYRRNIRSPYQWMRGLVGMTQEEVMKDFKAYWRDFAGAEVEINICRELTMPLTPEEKLGAIL